MFNKNADDLAGTGSDRGIVGSEPAIWSQAQNKHHSFKITIN